MPSGPPTAPSPVAVAAALALTLGGALGAGCRGRERAPVQAAPPVAAMAKVAPPVPAGSPPAPALGSAGVDCEQLLGARRASRAMGVTLVESPRSRLGPGECRYEPAPGDTSALVDVVVACREAAAPIARSVMSRVDRGFRSLAIGQVGVVVDDTERGVVQFLQREAPCAVEVTTIPAEHVVAVATEVSRGLGGGGEAR